MKNWNTRESAFSNFFGFLGESAISNFFGFLGFFRHTKKSLYYSFLRHNSSHEDTLTILWLKNFRTTAKCSINGEIHGSPENLMYDFRNKYLIRELFFWKLFWFFFFWLILFCATLPVLWFSASIATPIRFGPFQIFLDFGTFKLTDGDNKKLHHWNVTNNIKQLKVEMNWVPHPVKQRIDNMLKRVDAATEDEVNLENMRVTLRAKQISKKLRTIGHCSKSVASSEKRRESTEQSWGFLSEHLRPFICMNRWCVWSLSAK